MTRRFFKGWLIAALLFTGMAAMAEDIDLFLGVQGERTSVPNVLLMLDNTGNWSPPFVEEKAALVSTFNSLKTSTFNVGLMMFTETGGSDSGNDGAYVRAAIRPMTSANKTLYASLVNALDVGNDKSNSGKIGKAMEEAYLYFKGLEPFAGNKKAKTDYTGNAFSPNPAALGAQLQASRNVWALTGNALSSKNATTYNSPIAATTGCASKNYIIYISNGAAQDSSSDIAQANTALAARGGDTTQIGISPADSATNPADEWARFMYASSLGVVVYTIDINKVTTGQGPGWTALLKSVADVSGGKYFDVDTAHIEEALSTIFSEIQSVNSVFASVSLPVSVNTQGTFLNQVYVGMFRPDSLAKPVWAGNLKQYKLGLINGDVKLEDADAKSAINRQTGFITECGRSFWTPTTTNSAWSNKTWPTGTTFCIPLAGTTTNYAISDFPDGNIVEKGAQGYTQRQSASARTLKTCGATMATCTTLVDFNSTNVTVTQTGAVSTGTGTATLTATQNHQKIIDWAAGLDVQDDDLDTNLTEFRRSVHGDVVHSRPVAVNMGTEASPQVAVFYGSNDGIFRAINGNRTGAMSGVPAGGELWAFAPPEFYGNFKRLYDNSVKIAFQGTDSTGRLPKPYGMDGPITSFKGTIGGTSKTFVYASMRRGGRAMYAFDVTNIATSPSTTSLKWKVGCASTDDADCTNNMSGIGQTWSAPKTFTTAGYGSGASPLLIVGGGYDTCEDGDPNTCTSSAKGHFVYVIDADTGELLRSFDTGQGRSVVADSTIVRDTSGQAIYAYTSDLGGNVYRITFGTGDKSSWTIKRIAALGCANTSTCPKNRKFMFAPSVVAVNGNYDIMLGSGDREKPLTSYTSNVTVQNYFFKFTDKPALDESTYPGNSDGCGSNIICLGSLFEIVDNTTPTSTQLATKKGWALKMTSTEQVVTSAVTIFGVVTFSTHQPAVADATCTANLGSSRVYNISFLNAASANGTSNRFENLSGDGLPPSPVAGMVTLDASDGGATVPFCIGCSKDSPLEGKLPTSTGSVVRPKSRTYWYIQK